MKSTPDLNEVMDQCRKFSSNFQSLHLATLSATAEPEASYAAYVKHDDCYYIYTSDLSAHTANLSAHGRCSVLFIESEAQAKHLFARRRLTLQCAAIECYRDSIEFELLMDLFTHKFGEFFSMMRNLMDFHLYRLKPLSGAFVIGFAQAYTLEGEGLSEIRHRADKGHGHRAKGNTAEAVKINQAQAIRETFFELRRSSKARHRDIAEQLNISEGELIGAHVCTFAEDPDQMLKATRLKPAWADILAALEPLGEVMALTRNASCVHEKTGVYRNASCHQHMGLVLGEDIDLRLFYRRWMFGFAVYEQTAHGEQRSVQFFDAQGVAVHKVFLKSLSNIDAYKRLVMNFADDDQTTGIEVQPLAVLQPQMLDDAVDVKGLHEAWNSLRDTHDFFDLLKKFGVTRTQALRLADSKYVQQVDADECLQLLQQAASGGVPIMVFVSNPGVIQIHTGLIEKVVLMGQWVNVLDEKFNLHLREDHIASAWIVKKPTVDGLVTSMELFDSQGNTIAMFFGERKPGHPESGEWRTLVANIQQEPVSCVL